jgi:hypothetical protein
MTNGKRKPAKNIGKKVVRLAKKTARKQAKAKKKVKRDAKSILKKWTSSSKVKSTGIKY